MKLIICHVGHGAGITNEHMTLDLKWLDSKRFAKSRNEKIGKKMEKILSLSLQVTVKLVKELIVKN